jgi:hypothetical protein
MGIALAIVIVVVVLVAAAAFVVWRAPGAAGRLTGSAARRLTGSTEPSPRQLRRKYGPEFDRLRAEHGDEAAVVQELRRREKDRAALSIVRVSGRHRDRLTAEWTSAQAEFLDDPGRAARRAEQLIGEILAMSGYPVGDPQRQLALAGVDHPRGLSAFRDGHELLQRSNTGAPGVDATEQLRLAMLNFRKFFDDLLGDAEGASDQTLSGTGNGRNGRKVPA